MLYEVFAGGMVGWLVGWIPVEIKSNVNKTLHHPDPDMPKQDDSPSKVIPAGRTTNIKQVPRHPTLTGRSELIDEAQLMTRNFKPCEGCRRK